MSDAIRKIVVPIDGSNGATRACNFAGVLARATGAAVHLVLVHDSDAYVIGGMGEAAWVTSWEYAEVQQRLGEQLRENVVVPAFKAAREALGAVAGAVTEAAVWGHPAETICEQAKAEKADLIVMGSRGRAAFTELVLGSVSSQVLHHAPCPVTVVR